MRNEQRKDANEGGPKKQKNDKMIDCFMTKGGASTVKDKRIGNNECAPMR